MTHLFKPFHWLIALTIASTMPVQASELVADGAELTKIADGFKFTEGGARDAEGNVFFTDIPNNRIHKWDAKTNKVSVFAEDSGGANGCWVASGGQLYVCQGANRALAIFTVSGKQRGLIDEYARKKLNSPNDLWMDQFGGVYFSDPRYGENRSDLQQDGEHVYYLTPRLQLIRVAEDLVRPNGLTGSLDGKTLYISDHGAGKTYSYEIKPNGTLKSKKLFVDEGSDGVTIDERGNIYLTSGAVRIFNPQGEFLEEIPTPKPPSNVCFGGADKKTLFITARDAVYSIQMKVKGASIN
jgi:gluconolactonase